MLPTAVDAGRPQLLGLDFQDMAGLARRADDRSAQDRHRVATTQVPGALDEANEIGEAWQTGLGKGSTRPHSTNIFREPPLGSTVNPW
jgi:hypothetical protein